MYVAGNCEDLRVEYDSVDPHGGSFFWEDFDGFFDYEDFRDNFVTAIPLSRSLFARSAHLHSKLAPDSTVRSPSGQPLKASSPKYTLQVDGVRAFWS